MTPQLALEWREDPHVTLSGAVVDAVLAWCGCEKTAPDLLRCGTIATENEVVRASCELPGPGRTLQGGSDMTDGTCSIDGCSRKPNRRGLCCKHYKVGLESGWWRRPSAAERFWAKVNKVDGCWLWTGAFTQPQRQGYGSFMLPGGRKVAAHRFAYEQLVGPIPEGLQLDHLCRVKGCVNPAHLEPVTNAENQRRRPTFKCGHPKSEDNTTILYRGARGSRACTQCLAVRRHRYYLNRKARGKA